MFIQAFAENVKSFKRFDQDNIDQLFECITGLFDNLKDLHNVLDTWAITKKNKTIATKYYYNARVVYFVFLMDALVYSLKQYDDEMKRMKYFQSFTIHRLIMKSDPLKDVPRRYKNVFVLRTNETIQKLEYLRKMQKYVYALIPGLERISACIVCDMPTNLIEETTRDPVCDKYCSSVNTLF